MVIEPVKVLVQCLMVRATNERTDRYPDQILHNKNNSIFLTYRKIKRTCKPQQVHVGRQAEKQ